MSVETLDPLFKPRSLAIVGASPRSYYAQVLRANLAGFQGPVWYVNPNYDTFSGAPCYPSLTALPAVPEHVLVITPASAAVGIAQEAASVGSRAVTLYSSGYAESNRPEGKALDRALRDLVARRDILVCGPNCMGLVSPDTGFLAYSAQMAGRVQPGGLSLISHSGGLLVHWLPGACQRGLGIRHAVSAGNELGVTTPDYLEYFLDDAGTRMIALLFLEAVGDERRFVAALRRAQVLGKPVLVVKVGRTAEAARGSLTHTGRLSPPAAEFAAVLRSCGACSFDTADELIEGGLAFLQEPAPAGGRTAVVSASGALGNHMVDLVNETPGGLRMAELRPETLARIDAAAPGWLTPGNPLDGGYPGQSNPVKYAELARLLTEDPDVDLLLAEGDLDRVTGEQSRVRQPELLRSIKAAGKPVYFYSRVMYTPTREALARAAEHGVSYLQGTGRAVRSVAAVVRWQDDRRRWGEATEAPTGVRPWVWGAATRHDQLAEAFTACGIPVAPGERVSTAEDAVAAGRRLGWPVALKRLDVIHKTDQAALELDLRDATALSTAYERLAAIPGEAATYVQKMVAGGWPLLFGGKASAFGPLVIVALGGVFAEYLGDTATRLAPVRRDQAEEMLRELRGWSWLQRDRQGRSADVPWIVEAIVRFSQLVASACSQGVGSIEANPVLVGPLGSGGWAVDLRAEMVR